MHRVRGAHGLQVSAIIHSALLFFLTCQATGRRATSDGALHSLVVYKHALAPDAAEPIEMHPHNMSGALKEAGFSTEYARNAATPQNATAVTLLNAADKEKVYIMNFTVFIAILTFCLCFLVVQCSAKDRQGGSSEVGALMEVHDLSGEAPPSFWQDPLGCEDFRPDCLRKAMPRLALSVAIWVLGLYCNNVCQAWLQQNMADYYTSQWVPKSSKKDHVLLWDMGYKILPSLSCPWIAECLAMGPPILVVIRFCVFPGPLSMRWTFLSRMFLMWGLLWALRAITIISTVLPNPDGTCKPRIAYPNNIFQEALANMPFVFWRHETTCHDVMFSGHTVILTLASLMWVYYADWAPWPEWCNCSSFATLVFRLSVFLMTLTGYLCIIASKFHYTADVLMGCMLTVFIFQAYHSSVRSAFLPRAKGSVLLRNSFQSFLAWFDEDAVDVAVLRRLLQQSIPTQC